MQVKILMHKFPCNVLQEQMLSNTWLVFTGQQKNVNLILESTNECKPDCIVDSKDATTVICGDIQPVQNPGKSWKQISYPDHTFDQSCTNAVYPMTHLFLDDVRSSSFKDGENVVEIMRTGCPVSLINIAISELETTFSCNE